MQIIPGVTRKAKDGSIRLELGFLWMRLLHMRPVFSSDLLSNTGLLSR
jgi:hypothetical protein